MSSVIKLNLGSGPNSCKGWLNFDWGVLPLLSKFPFLLRFGIRLNLLPKGYDVPWPPIRLVDIRKKLPLCEGTVQFIYNFRTGKHYRVSGIIQKIIRLICQERLKPIRIKGRRQEIERQYVSIQKAKQELGWRPKYSLEHRPVETIKWHQNLCEH